MQDIKNLGEKVLAWRLRNHTTQAQLARILGTSQAYISRIERGAISAPTIGAEILRLLGIRESEASSAAYTLAVTRTSDWRLAHFSYPAFKGGDRIQIDSKTCRNKIVAFHCDAAGSDQRASVMAEQLVVSFETAVNAYRDTFVSGEAIYSAMDGTLRSTRDLWRGLPSANFVIINRQSSRIELLNAGMPEGLMYRAGKKNAETIGSFRVPPIGSYQNTPVLMDLLSLDKGDVFFVFSDGFLGEFERLTQQRLQTYFESFSVALKGDCEAIGWKFLRTLDLNGQGQQLRDNLSFLLVSK